MLVDCFPFFNEFELLKLRISMLNPFVDKFVIQELGETHSGQKKIKRLHIDSPEFSDVDKSKIVILSEESFPPGLEPFERDWHQRDLAEAWLSQNMRETDLLLYGDVDEIPNPTALSNVLKSDESSQIHFFAMKMSYGFINYAVRPGKLLSNLGEFENVRPRDRMWIGSVLWPWGHASGRRPSELRTGSKISLSSGVRVSDGGWHFSYVDGNKGDAISRVLEKLESSAHQEFNTERVKRLVEHRFRSGRDPLGRRFVRFSEAPLTDYPREVRSLAQRRPDMVFSEGFPKRERG
jgi:beta-1,4-mannosyl-glycoprotein beta-1,4-N-acetylglucosaminyltransferase